MRIDTSTRITASSSRSPMRPGQGAAFAPGYGAATSRAMPMAAAAQAAPIDALLALQAAVDDAGEIRRRAVRRGRSMLDTLDALKADLLAGQLGEARLALLGGLIAEARDDLDPGLAAVLDDIELRVRVELAKRGRFS